MSLSIDTRRISGVYAFGQWFKVVPNSFAIDSYELLDRPLEHCPFGNENGAYTDCYTLGSLYERSQPEAYRAAIGDNASFSMVAPQGAHGICFIDAETDESVYFSLLECKAFRCVSEELAIQADSKLTPVDRGKAVDAN